MIRARPAALAAALVVAATTGPTALPGCSCEPVEAQGPFIGRAVDGVPSLGWHIDGVGRWRWRRVTVVDSDGHVAWEAEADPPRPVEVLPLGAPELTGAEVTSVGPVVPPATVLVHTEVDSTPRADELLLDADRLRRAGPPVVARGSVPTDDGCGVDLGRTIRALAWGAAVFIGFIVVVGGGAAGLLAVLRAGVSAARRR